MCLPPRLCGSSVPSSSKAVFSCSRNPIPSRQGTGFGVSSTKMGLGC